MRGHPEPPQTRPLHPPEAPRPFPTPGMFFEGLFAQIWVPKQWLPGLTSPMGALWGGPVFQGQAWCCLVAGGGKKRCRTSKPCEEDKEAAEDEQGAVCCLGGPGWTRGGHSLRV